MNCLENLSLENDSISVNICVLMLNQIRTYICLVIEMFVLFLFIYAYYTCIHIHIYIHIYICTYICNLMAT